jgi:hypothetical protein
MNTSQIVQVFVGLFWAILYACAVIGVGATALSFILKGRQSVVIDQIGVSGIGWLAFVIGQGILGVIILILMLIGVLYSWFVFILVGLGCVLFVTWMLGYRTHIKYYFLDRWKYLQGHNKWYSGIVISLLILFIVFGILSVLPPHVADALARYLVTPKVVAYTHKLMFQPFSVPFYGLLPLQVETHWAALFTIANETAVTVWDFFCGVSFICGVGILARLVTGNIKVGIIASLMMFSTPAVYELLGAAKTDNAGAQFGLAIFLCLFLSRYLKREGFILAGLNLGWSFASRYTNIIIITGFLIFVFYSFLSEKDFQFLKPSYNKKLILTSISIIILSLILAFAMMLPVLFKNWLFVGCPLAPQLGCSGTFWSDTFRAEHSSLDNISMVELLLYPFTITFGNPRNMLGNLSPLYLGLLPIYIIFRRTYLVRSTTIHGQVALVILLTWLAVEPFILFTRWLLIPFALLSIPLAAGAVEAEKSLENSQFFKIVFRSSIFLIILYLFFECRSVVYSAKYILGLNSREQYYQSYIDPQAEFRLSQWLNKNVKDQERVALQDFSGYRYLLAPPILLNSETARELQKINEVMVLEKSNKELWKIRWKIYQENGFRFIVIKNDELEIASSYAFDNGIPPGVIIKVYSDESLSVLMLLNVITDK